MSTDQAILATLAYHDIFDYPLTKEEINRFLIDKKAADGQILATLKNLVNSKKIGERRGFFFLKGRASIVATRQKRQKYSKLKLKRSRLYGQILKLIPTIKLVAVSGALAMQNCQKDDDIDLVIITSPRLLWTTRFFANLLLWPFKRKPQRPLTINHSPFTSNKACLNLFIDSSNLRVKPQNLYLAHEICQMKPIWDRSQTYSHFIKANSWTQKFLPNWKIENQLQMTSLSRHSRDRVSPKALAVAQSGNPGAKKALVVSRLSFSVEILLKKFQLWYMKSKISTERIGDTQLFFHPSNIQDWVMNKYQKRLSHLKIITKNSNLV